MLVAGCGATLWSKGSLVTEMHTEPTTMYSMRNQGAIQVSKMPLATSSVCHLMKLYKTMSISGPVKRLWKGWSRRASLWWMIWCTSFEASLSVFRSFHQHSVHCKGFCTGWELPLFCWIWKGCWMLGESNSKSLGERFPFSCLRRMQTLVLPKNDGTYACHSGFNKEKQNGMYFEHLGAPTELSSMQTFQELVVSPSYALHLNYLMFDRALNMMYMMWSDKWEKIAENMDINGMSGQSCSAVGVR